MAGTVGIMIRSTAIIGIAGGTLVVGAACHIITITHHHFTLVIITIMVLDIPLTRITIILIGKEQET